MNRKDYILLDLDGILADLKEGITKLVQHALEHFDIQTDDLDSLTPFIGPLLRDSSRRYYGFSDEQAWRGMQVYREYFSIRGWVQNKKYPDVKEMLGTLREAERVLLVATSKPEEFAKETLNHFDMTEHFGFISDADMGETRVCRADMIRYMLKQCGPESDDEAIRRYVAVGDREHDILRVRECGMECVGVLYGYGDRQEMDVYRPAWVAETVKDLRDLLLLL